MCLRINSLKLNISKKINKIKFNLQLLSILKEIIRYQHEKVLATVG